MAWKFVSLGTWIIHVYNKYAKSWKRWEQPLQVQTKGIWRLVEVSVTIDEVIEESRCDDVLCVCNTNIMITNHSSL